MDGRQVTYRMVDDVSGFVGMYPHPCERGIVRLVDDADAFWRSANAAGANTSAWRPIGDGFLGQATGFIELGEAREKLDDVAGLYVSV
jgi:hypothetical protein